MKVFSHLTANDVQLESFRFKSELAMGAYLIENQGVLALDGDAFNDVEILDAELTLKGGRASKNADGRIDILATYSPDYIAIVELKLDQLTCLHLTQLEDYLKERNQILNKHPRIFDKTTNDQPKWIGVLVGCSIETGLANKLSAGYSTDSSIQIAALTLQRFRSKKDGNIYVATDTFFKESTSSRDNTKYRFNGMMFGKSRLVLAVIKQYVASNPSASFAALEKVFPKSCQRPGTLGVFATYEDANKIFEQTGYRRHFLKPDHLISLSDSTIAICNQWGIDNINEFIKHAKNCGCEITPTK